MEYFLLFLIIVCVGFFVNHASKVADEFLTIRTKIKILEDKATKKPHK